MTDKEKIRAEIERLKEPHERNLKKPMERGRIGYAHGCVDCCDRILDFIDSLPEEKPNVWDRVDINKVIKARVKKTGEIIAGFYDGNGHFDHFIDHDVFDRYSIDDVEIPYEEFIAGLNPPPKIPQMKTDKGLEEAAEEYEKEHTYQRYDGGGFTPDSTVGIGEAFIAGAEWQKEQDKPITGNSLEKEWLRYVNKAKKEYGGELPSLGEYGWLQIARHFAEWQKAQMMKEAIDAEIVKDIHNLLHVKSGPLPMPTKVKFGDKVKIIIVKEDKQ